MAARRLEAAFLLAIGGLLIGFCLLGLFHYEYPWALMRFPLLAAAVTLALAAVQLALLRTARRTEAGGAAGGRRAAWVGMLWLLSALPLVYLLGFPAGLALYLLCVLKRSGETWRLSVAIAGASLLLSYGLFAETLGVPLPLWPAWWPAAG